MNLLSTFILALTILGCSSGSKNTTVTGENKPAASSPVQTATVETTAVQTTTVETTTAKADSADQNNFRFTVSFYSIGEGSEGAQIGNFEKFIADKSLKINRSIQVEKTPWGREGEVDFCMKLSEFQPKEQDQFIAETKAALASAKHVHYSENSPCRLKRRR